MKCINCNSEINSGCTHKELCCFCFEIIVLLIGRRIASKIGTSLVTQLEFETIADNEFRNLNLFYTENLQ